MRLFYFILATMAQCEAKKSDGSQCKGNAKDGNKWCSFHQKRYAKTVKHGNTASPELLGIPKTQHVTFQAFYEQEKPLELLSEIAYLRTLGVELRQTIERNREGNRQELLEEFKKRLATTLIDAGMEESDLEEFTEEVADDLDDILLEYIGPAEPLSPADIGHLAEHIETISRVAERAKKIKDGFTLNIDLSNVHGHILRYTQQCILSVVTDRYLRSKIVENTRAFLTSGISGPKEEIFEGELV